MKISILAFESKNERKENSRSKIGRKKKEKERKFPIKDRKKTKENIQKGLWTRQYLNNTQLSQANKKRKETTTGSGPLPLITNQNLVRWQLFRPALIKSRKGKSQNTQSQISLHKTLLPKKIPIDP